METGDLTQVAINILEWSWDIVDVIWNPLTSTEWFWHTIMDNSIRFWLALIIFFIRLTTLIWVIKDANARSSSFRFRLLSASLIILFTPIFGTLLYIAIRPQWWKWDKTERRDTLFQNSQLCNNCWEFNKIENTYCTNCWECMCTTCRECQSKYAASYNYCPDCGAPNLDA